MANVFEKARLFVKNVTDVFEKADGERFKCPRCKGSGLLRGRQVWNWNQPAPDNDPCWFCEGVGAMPTVGLNGFMLGRSKPTLNTTQISLRPQLPIKMQLYLGKYPETKCTLRTYKPSTDITDLLYDPYHSPSWIDVIGGDAIFSNIQDDSEIIDWEEFYSLPSFSSKNPSEYSGQQASQNRNISANRNQVSVSPHFIRQPISSASGDLQNIPRKGSYTEAVSSLPSDERRIERRVRRQSSLRRASGNLFRTLRTSVTTYLDPLNLSSIQTVQNQTRRGSPGDSKAHGVKKTYKSPVLTSLVTLRSLRRERNRVREEAEKDAVQRAHKSQKPSTSQPELSDSITSDSSGSTGLAGSTDEGFGTLSPRRTNIFNDQNLWRQMVVPSKGISSDLITINEFLYAKVRDGILWTPMHSKSF